MHELLDLFKSLTDPERLIQLLSTVMTGWLGYALLIAIVFAETGLLVGFFLPGDSLLFTVGVVAGAGKLDIVLINLVLIAAAIVGDAVGYLLGRTTGPKIFNRPDSTFFRKEHLRKTQEFYDKHGGKTIIYARFVPIVRTFAPFIAGVAGMPYSRFLAFNIFGGIGWVVTMTTLGYSLGGIEIIRKHFDKVVVLIVFVSVLPVLLELWKSRQASKKITVP